jgi:hypothetical protein
MENNVTGYCILSRHTQIQGHSTCNMDLGMEGPQQVVATTALLHHRGKHRNGYEGLRRQMEDSSPNTRHTSKDRGRGSKERTYKFQGGRAGTYTIPGSPSSQETKDGPDQNKVDKIRDI